MKIIVTGGAGFIGSNLVEKLIILGHNVICIDNESSDGHSHFYWNKKAKNYKLDICDFNAIENLFQNIDYVFHLAAEARIMKCINNPLKTIKTNVIGTANVLEASKKYGVKRLIYSSTSSAYGRNSTPNNESQLDDCLNPYSLSKVSGEKLCSLYFNLYGLQTIILRYFNVYGNHQPTKGQYTPIIGLFLNQKNKNQPLTIVGDGTQRRDFTNVLDVVEANILSTKEIDPIFFGTIFNIGSGINYSILEIAKMVSENYEFIEKRPGEMKETLADISKAKKILGWEPKINLKNWLDTNK